MLILKFIKRYSNTDKVSLEDLKKFIDKSNIIHILLTNEHISNLEQ